MQIELSADMRKRQRVAERNEFRGFLASHDRRDAGDPDDVSLLRAAGRNDLESFRLHADNALSCCRSVSNRFLSHVHHVCLSLGVEVCQSAVLSHFVENSH